MSIFGRNSIIDKIAVVPPPINKAAALVDFPPAGPNILAGLHYVCKVGIEQSGVIIGAIDHEWYLVQVNDAAGRSAYRRIVNFVDIRDWVFHGGA